MRFAILAFPGSDPGDARARAVSFAAVHDAADVAEAARAADAPYVLLLAPGARPLPGAFGGLQSFAVLPGVIGGAAHAGGTRAFGWMLAPAPCGPLPFELVPIAAPLAESGTDARVRGAVDVVAPGMLLAARELLFEPLPDDQVAALVELCARARASGREVVCRPAFACEMPPLDADDRGRLAALRALAERRPELTGTHRLPPAARRTHAEREQRLDGGSRRMRVRIALPPLTVLVHGQGAELAARRARELAPVVHARAVDDPAAALRAEMSIRGDRYLLLASAARLPDRDAFDALVAAVESAPFVAMAAPNAAALDGSCVLLALARFPQHLTAQGGSLSDALGTLAGGAAVLRRAVRAPGYVAPCVAPAEQRRATIVFLASSLPEIMRVTLDAVVPAARRDDELVAVCAANAATTRRILAVYPQLHVATDESDPLLCEAANRAVSEASRELIVVIADDVLLPAGALDRLRDAFVRVPSLGAAFPAVAGAVGGEGVHDVAYADLAQLRTLAERRARVLSGRLEPIELAVTPAVAVTREAFDAVGGIDPAHGPTSAGIADLVLRLRAAGYGVVRCDDALAHRFEPAQSHNPAAAASAYQTIVTPDAAVLARGFDPARRVPFVRSVTALQSVRDAHDGPVASLAIAVPVAGAAELERAVRFIASAARAFDASSPIRLHVVLDGDIAPADVVTRIRPVLAASGKSMDETVAVRIERTVDLTVWRAGLEPGVRVVVAAGHERADLRDLAAVTAGALADLPEPVLR